ncbi:MAG: hypothetical protein FWG07_09960, partial [Treponema sp.]|nr:hypothetical protein [Treponema sp.]
MTSKLPPFSDSTTIDNEKQILGAYILGAPIGENITESVFCTTGHRTIFPVIKELKENGLALDLMILVSELTKQKKLDAAGGSAYIAELTSVFSTVNTPHYEIEVLKAYKGRALWRA